MFRKFNILLSLGLIILLALAACAPAAQTPAAEAPAATEAPAVEAPAATEAPAAEAPAATEEPAAEAPATTEEPAAEAPAATEELAAEAPAATEEPAADAAATEEAMAETGEAATIRWWHISTAEADAAAWQELADQYMAEHPNVTIEITILENEAFKQRLTTVMQGGDPPDLFQSWGGGVLWEFAKAGLVRDISAELEGEWRDSIATQSALELYGQNGEYYGVPWRWGAVGLFQNVDLFEQAGLDASCPATYDDLLANVQTIKDAGITPIALGEGDKWPGHFWWVYLAIRSGGEDAFLAAYNRTGSFTDEPFVRAGELLQQLVELEPFQDGYLGLAYPDEAALFGNGQAAMELMGHWGPSVAASNSESGEGVSNLVWCPFPTVEGGAGNPEDVLGGGDGFAIGKNAPDATVDFMRFLTSEESQRHLAEANLGPGVIKGIDDTVKEDWLKQIIEARNNAAYFQLYYDQFLPPAVGGTVNDAVEQLFAGAATPEEVATQIEDSAALELEQ